MSKYSSSSLEQARRRAMHMAAREHIFLHTDLTKRIDIFEILERKGLRLRFDPLDSLYGAYICVNNAHGIIINAKHPPSLQRFTAAHEYGHFVMKHQSSWDGEEQILPMRQTYELEEIEAQSFAAHFLMPLQLVNATLHNMGLPLKLENIAPQEIYRLSLELGASYLAIVNHLVTLKKLSPKAANELRRKQPKLIKKGIGGGITPQDSWADVWVFNKQDTERKVSVYVNDELYIYLPEEPVGNNSWIVSGSLDSSLVILIKSDLQITSPEEPGEEYSPYVRCILLRTQTPGYTILQLEKRGALQERFILHINILPKQTQGFSEKQKLLLLDF